MPGTILQFCRGIIILRLW